MNYVTSLKLSKKLKEAGVEQDSEFYHYFNAGKPTGAIVEGVVYQEATDEFREAKLLSAFLTDELLEKLPQGYMIVKRERGYMCEDLDVFIEPSYRGGIYDTPSEAAGRMLLWVKENI